MFATHMLHSKLEKMTRRPSIQRETGLDDLKTRSRSNNIDAVRYFKVNIIKKKHLFVIENLPRLAKSIVNH